MIDGCIVNTIKGIVDLYNEDFVAYKKYHYIRPQDIHTWNFEECNCASSNMIDTYFNTPRFFNRLEFMNNAEYVLSLLFKQFDITIVSHGYSPNLKLKKEWINANVMPILFKTNPRLGVNHFDFIGVNLKEHEDKSCVDMSDGIFVDDSTKNLVTSNAKYKIVFGEYYPWNAGNETTYFYPRAIDWMELYKKIIALQSNKM